MPLGHGHLPTETLSQWLNVDSTTKVSVVVASTAANNKGE